ncbi:MAG: PorT family protein [Crocinitomicaceae bacterium]|nr:PorT family protein [Crocinitomicaceae bacterium]
MKILKLVTLTVVISCSNSHLFAQKFGIRAGGNVSSMVIKDNYIEYTSTPIPGFHLGVFYNYELKNSLSFQPEIHFTTKGVSSIYYDGPTLNLPESKVDISMYYLDIPLNLKSTFDLFKNKMYVTLGPVIGFGLAGKVKTSTTFLGETFTDSGDIKFGSNADTDNLKRFDLGLGAGVGYQLNHLQFGINYNFGLLNISPNTSNGTVNYNRNLSVTIAYTFGE